MNFNGLVYSVNWCIVFTCSE